MESLKTLIPDFAKDAKLNLAQVERTEGLTPKQLWGTALATALNAGHQEVIAAVLAGAGAHLDEASKKAAAGAAAIMAMNNVYYRFTHLVSDKTYASMPARLRMQVIANPGAERLDFELWCLAVSAVNGCGACVDSHEKKILESGGTREMVQNAVRVASIVHAAAAALRMGEALQAAEQQATAA